MFRMSWNPPTRNMAGEIYGRNAMMSAQMLADAQERASQVEAQSMLDSANRRHQAIIDGAGMVGDVAKKAVGFMVGGPAGAAMASSMGGGGDGGGGLLDTFTQYFGAKEGSRVIDKMAGMAKDEGLMTQDTLEKFINLPWQEKAPVFDLWRQTMMPIQANRMKVQDQAQIWSDYRGGGGGMPASAAANRYGYVYQGP